MKNELTVMIKESGLDKTKAKVLLDNFSDYFQVANEWEKKAKTIIVKDASQKADMQMARVGRLFLREKRIKIEKTRKELKQQSLREGKAIDGIANVLKALIVPIEEYLEKQEKFVEIKAKEQIQLTMIEMEKKAEKDRLAKEEAERKEQERIRLENERLKKEAIAKEKKIEKAESERIAQETRARIEKAQIENRAKAEKEKQEKILADQRAKAEAEKRALEEKARKERVELERKARIEKDKQDRIIAEQKAKIETERVLKLKIAEKARKVREAEQARIQAELDKQIECPFCHRKFTLKKGKKKIN